MLGGKGPAPTYASRECQLSSKRIYRKIRGYTFLLVVFSVFTDKIVKISAIAECFSLSLCLFVLLREKIQFHVPRMKYRAVLAASILV